MKEPIEAKDIRKGDLIRKEYAGDMTTRATEYRAVGGAHEYSNAGGTYFLLDRPKPPVTLPTEPGAYLTAINMKSGPFLVVLDSSGDWHDFSLVHADRKNWTPEFYAPLTKLEPVAETAKRVIERMAMWWEFGPPKNFQDEFNAIAAEFGVVDS